MDPQRKKNVILLSVVFVLLAGAAVFGFRDAIFGSAQDVTPAEVQAAIEDSAKAAEPMPAEPPKPAFTKTARPISGH